MSLAPRCQHWRWDQLHANPLHAPASHPPPPSSQPSSSHWPTMAVAVHHLLRVPRSNPRPLPGPVTCWGSHPPCSYPEAWRGEPSEWGH